MLIAELLVVGLLGPKLSSWEFQTRKCWHTLTTWIVVVSGQSHVCTVVCVVVGLFWEPTCNLCEFEQKNVSLLSVCPWSNLDEIF